MFVGILGGEVEYFGLPVEGGHSVALDGHGLQTQAELAHRAGCEPPSITGMVQRLQAAGLIDRSPAPGDARATIVELTEQGRAMMPELKSVWIQLAIDTVAAMPGRARRELTSTLQVLAESLCAARP